MQDMVGSYPALVEFSALVALLLGYGEVEFLGFQIDADGECYRVWKGEERVVRRYALAACCEHDE